MARKSKHSGPKYANGNYKSYQKKYDSSELQIRKRTNLTKKIVNVVLMVTEMVKMYPTKRMDLQPLKLHLRTVPVLVKLEKHDAPSTKS
jgi:hypothetical protein